MTQELSGRVAIVTGAGRNIGRGIALALADAGAAVVVNARSNLKEAEAVAGEIERGGGTALAVTADVADADAVGAMVAAAASRFGRIDILVNNAAVRVEQALETMTLADWRAVTGVILDGAFNCVKACLPHLKRSGRGRIIAVTSSAVKEPTANLGLSNTVRPGVVGYLKSLSNELGPQGITVNCVAPGRIDTERLQQLDQATAQRQGRSAEEVRRANEVAIPLGRYGRPEEFAAAVAFLASDRASYITGITLYVDGGKLACIV